MYCQSGPGGRGEGRRQEAESWRGRQTGRIWTRIMMIQNNLKDGRKKMGKKKKKNEESEV